jgi:hypothetical protein
MQEGEKTANFLKLLKMLQARLSTKSKHKSHDMFGNIQYIDADIYSTETLMTFLEMSLSDFNCIPHFTNFSFEDSPIVEKFASLLVEGAVIYALGSQALLERGREYTTVDNGVTLSPPTVSELLQTQYAQLYQIHWEKLKYVKSHIKDLDR